MVDAARAGNASALSELYTLYFPRVYRYILARTGNTYDAEDLAEEVFMRVLEAIERFQWREAPFSAWLFRIAHNAIANSHRARRRRRTQPIADARQQAAPGADPASVVARADQQREIRAALARIPAERRHAILLRFVDGLSAREIGAVLDRSDGAARVLLHRALRDLAAELDRGDA